MIGQQIGNYRLVKLLGSGGMGMVYEAVHDGIGGRAAIKVLRPEVAINKDATQRFFSEARAANLIAHPGIVHIFDCGYTSNGVAFLAMEFLQGETLRQRLDRLRTMTVSETIRMARQVAATLHAAHQRSVVHRDLKPDNLMIVQEPELPGGERVKLLDFGVAKIAEGMAEKTKTGTVMGTPAYMAPEQCRDAKLATDRSDVYSLGIILYQCLAGRPPFVGEYIGDVLAMQMMQDPPRLTDFNPRVQNPMVEFVHRLLEKKPTMRPSMEEVVRELQRLLELLTKSQTQVSGAIPHHSSRPQTERLSSDEIRQLAPTAPRPMLAPIPNRVPAVSEEIASRQTEPLSVLHLPRPFADKNPIEVGAESDTPSVLPRKQADSDAPPLDERSSAAQAPRNVNLPEEPAVPAPNLRPPMQHSVTLATGQRGLRGSQRFWVSGMLALTLTISLSLYFASSRNPVYSTQRPVQPMDASTETITAPMDASLLVDMAEPTPDLLLPPSRPERRILVRDEKLAGAIRAWSDKSWAEAAKLASECGTRGEAKYKCPWILGMATCQLIKTNADPQKRLYMDRDLTYALMFLREQNERQFAKEVEQFCASLGVSVSALVKSEPPPDPLQIRNPFQK